MCARHDVQAKEIETWDGTTELVGTQVTKCVSIRFVLNYLDVVVLALICINLFTMSSSNGC